MHKLCIYIICQGPERFFQLLYKIVIWYSFKLKINIYTLKAFVQTLVDLPNNYISDNAVQVFFFFAVLKLGICVNTMDSDSKRNSNTLEHDRPQHVRHFALKSPKIFLPSSSPICAFIPANKNLTPVSKLLYPFTF